MCIPVNIAFYFVFVFVFVFLSFFFKGFITCDQEAKFPKGTFKGVCKVEDKHAGSWGLPQKQADRDSRAQLYIDSRYVSIVAEIDLNLFCCV